MDAQLSRAWAQKQIYDRHCLEKISDALHYFARQGIAIRGHVASNRNMPQLLKVLAKDDHVLANWLLQSHDYTSPQIQNELLSLYGNTIVSQIATSIKSQSVLQYSIIIDGTQDISGKEQESICFRYVDHDLVPHEDFVELYEVSGTRGEDIAKIAEDVIQRMNLPLSGLRGQTYDGAANMVGKVNGTQALVKRHHPLALYVHCGVHTVCLQCVNHCP